ncbi:MAG: hypothetical protein LBH22_04120 [Bacteroidales bacterium]|nr:hypothetical protein [Bacteroidales bacterium]
MLYICPELKKYNDMEKSELEKIKQQAQERWDSGGKEIYENCKTTPNFGTRKNTRIICLIFVAKWRKIRTLRLMFWKSYQIIIMV